MFSILFLQLIFLQFSLVFSFLFGDFSNGSVRSSKYCRFQKIRRFIARVSLQRDVELVSITAAFRDSARLVLFLKMGMVFSWLEIYFVLACNF